MYLVGLTGGIASGKSAVAARFLERGAVLIDADVIAREIVLPGTKGWDDIVEHFGTVILDERGFIDRPKLGRIVFADPERRKVLNSLTHPRVAEEIAARMAGLKDFEGLVVLDVPLLVEAGIERGYRAVLVVAAQPETQLRRLVELRGMDPEEASQRIAAQAPLADKLARATHVIWNEGTLDELRERADEVFDQLQAAAQA
jgi:dephospho-CoA kinase